jgi:pre-mRNA-processing factor 40
MSDSDRELYFSDFVIDLHAAEDEKRRRIRDARKRAEKAQREEYKDMLSRLAAKGTITPSSKWRNLEELLSAESAFGPITDHDREGPREIFQNFIDEWNETYRRDRTFLSDLMHPTPGKRIVVTKDTSYEDFTKSLLDQVEHSQKLCTELREILNHHEPVSSVRVYFDELTMRTRDPASADVRRLAKRGSLNDDSSEDEGEIIEEGEIRDEGEAEMEIANNNNGKTKS